MPLQVSAILLAAGSSRRMGQPKQLLPLGNKTVIRHCLDNLFAAGIEDIIVVLNQKGSQILDSMKDLPVKIVFNENPESEMAESVRIGLRAVADSSSGVLVHLSDHPLVSAATLESIIQCYFETPDKIIVPLCEGKRGHPGLFPMPVINEAFEGFTLRDIINRNSSRIKILDVDDEGVILDMDTKEDYERICGKKGLQNPDIPAHAEYPCY